MNRLLVRNARYLGEKVDVLVDGGRIASMAPSGGTASEGVDTFEADGLVLFPSFVDCHTHLREPGFEWKETVATGLAAAAHGGFGQVMCMANTSPTNDAAAVTELILKRARESWPHGPFVHPVGAATVGLRGEVLAPMAELKTAGCIAFSNDGVPIASTEMMRRIIEYASDLGCKVIDHCEDPWLAKGTCMNEGCMSGKLGLRGQPVIAEAIQVERDILLAEYLDVPVHLAHISCVESIRAIRAAKERGVKVTAETCPHYLLLTEDVLEGFNLAGKVNPPLRTTRDMEAVRTAVKDGALDILVTDHAPHALHEKERPLAEGPHGFTGMDLALTMVYTLVEGGVLTEADLVRLWVERPAEIFGLTVNRFRQGDPADFFLFDPGLEWTVDKGSLYSKSANTPWYGKKVRGRVVAHWLGGVRLF